MRLKLSPNAWAMVLTSKVLAKPGTPPKDVTACKNGGRHFADDVFLAHNDFPTSVSKASCWVRSASSADLSSENSPRFRASRLLPEDSHVRLARSVHWTIARVGLRTDHRQGAGFLSDAGFQMR